jgi:hypothetical protein
MTAFAYVFVFIRNLLRGVCRGPFTFTICFLKWGVRGGVVVEVLRYKPEGRGFDSRWCHLIFAVT